MIKGSRTLKCEISAVKTHWVTQLKIYIWIEKKPANTIRIPRVKETWQVIGH